MRQMWLSCCSEWEAVLYYNVIWTECREHISSETEQGLYDSIKERMDELRLDPNILSVEAKRNGKTLAHWVK